METSKVMKILKNLIRDKKLSYEHIAKHADIPISTFKKNMASQKIDLNKFLIICDVLDVSPKDVMSLAESEESHEKYTLTAQQDSFFSQHPIQYLVLDKLYHKRLELEEIKEQLMISDQEIQDILSSLENLGLIEIIEGEVKLLFSSGVQFLTKGAFSKTIAERSSKGLVSFLLMQRKHEFDGLTPANFFRLTFSEMTTQTAKELSDALNRLNREFSIRSERERKMYQKEDLHSVSLLMASAHCDALDFIADTDSSRSEPLVKP